MVREVIGKTATGAIKTLLRTTSTGEKATIGNADHHAKNLLPLVEGLLPFAEYLPLKEWRQGNNVHIFITEDDRGISFRPIRGYAGIQVAMRKQIGREVVELPVFNLYSALEIPELVNLLRSICKPTLDRRKGIVDLVKKSA